METAVRLLLAFGALLLIYLLNRDYDYWNRSPFISIGSFIVGSGVSFTILLQQI